LVLKLTSTDAPVQNSGLQINRNFEVVKEHYEHKEIIDREGLLYQIACEELLRSLQPMSLCKSEAKGSSCRNCNCRSNHGSSVGLLGRSEGLELGLGKILGFGLGTWEGLTTVAKTCE